MIGTIIKQVVKLLPKEPYGFPGGSRVKNPPALWEILLRSLGWEDPWRRERPPTPVFWPGELHEQKILAGYSPWDHKELDILSIFHFHLSTIYIPWERVSSFQLEYEWKETVFGPRKLLWRVYLRIQNQHTEIPCIPIH